jgi:hypothetical protein
MEEFDQELLLDQYHLSTDAEIIQNITESKYCPISFNKFTAECHLLNTDQQQSLSFLRSLHTCLMEHKEIRKHIYC